MKKILARGGIEFLAIFLGIALSLLVDDYKNKTNTKNKIKSLLPIKSKLFLSYLKNINHNPYSFRALNIQKSSVSDFFVFAKKVDGRNIL